MPSFKPIAVNTAGATVPYEEGQYIMSNVSFSDGTTTYAAGAYVDIQGKRQQLTTQGPPGKNGVAYAIKGQVDSVSELPTPTQELIGTAYFVGTTTPRNVYFCVEYNGVVQWEDQGELEGPQGPAGPQGEQGKQGEQGVAGISYRHNIQIRHYDSTQNIIIRFTIYNNNPTELNSGELLNEYLKNNGIEANGFCSSFTSTSSVVLNIFYLSNITANEFAFYGISQGDTDYNDPTVTINSYTQITDTVLSV